MKVSRGSLEFLPWSPNYRDFCFITQSEPQTVSYQRQEKSVIHHRFAICLRKWRITCWAKNMFPLSHSHATDNFRSIDVAKLCANPLNKWLSMVFCLLTVSSVKTCRQLQSYSCSSMKMRYLTAGDAFVVN